MDVSRGSVSDRIERTTALAEMCDAAPIWTSVACRSSGSETERRTVMRTTLVHTGGVEQATRRRLTSAVHPNAEHRPPRRRRKAPAGRRRRSVLAARRVTPLALRRDLAPTTLRALCSAIGRMARSVVACGAATGRHHPRGWQGTPGPRFPAPPAARVPRGAPRPWGAPCEPQRTDPGRNEGPARCSTHLSGALCPRWQTEAVLRRSGGLRMKAVATQVPTEHVCAERWEHRSPALVAGAVPRRLADRAVSLRHQVLPLVVCRSHPAARRAGGGCRQGRARRVRAPRAGCSGPSSTAGPARRTAASCPPRARPSP